MTGFVLRIIAMITMVIDHVGFSLAGNPMIMRCIGRIAFPVYAFLLADGFLHFYKDKDRVMKHLSTLVILFFVSEFFVDTLEFGLNFSEYFESQNVMITLLLGYLGMIITEKIYPRGNKNNKVNIKNICVLAGSYLLLGFANLMMNGNFNLVGPLLVIAFYWFLRESRNAKNENNWSLLKRFSYLLLIFAIYLPIYFWVRTDFGSYNAWIQTLHDYSPWILGHFFAVIILSLYNGKLGYNKPWFKKLYLYMYPLNAAVIGLIHLLFGI